MGATLLLTLGALLAFLCWQFYVIGADIADPRGQPRSWGWVTLVTGPIGILLLYIYLPDKRQPTQAPTRRSPRSQPAVAPSPAQQPEAPPADEPPQEEPPEPPPTDEPPEEPPPRPIQRH